MSSINLSTRLSVYVDLSTHFLYEKFTSRAIKKAEDYPFETMKDLFIVSACVGARNNKYLELERNKEIFDSSLFNPSTEVPVLLSLAYIKTKNFENLTEGRQVLDIVQGWANGGIRILESQLLNGHRRPLFNLLDFMWSEFDVDSEINDDISVLKSGFSEERNIELTNVKPSKNFNITDCADLLTILEVELRQFIVYHLERKTSNWFKQRTSEEIRQRAEKRKTEREQKHPGLDQQDRPKHDYLDFTDLKTIITMKNNWEEVFKDTFKRSDIIQVKLDEIALFRNDIAHHRDIPTNDREIFVSNARQILRIIREKI